MNLLDEFINHLEEQHKNHSIYVWGAQGQKGAQITEAWIRRREKNANNAARAIAYWRKQIAAGYGEILRAFDCSGLGMYWIQNITGLCKDDRNANGMMAICARIKKEDCKRGDWVFKTYAADQYDSAGKRTHRKGEAYHIGYVVDNALNVIECKGRDDGVVKRPISAGGWAAFGRPHIFEKYITEEKPKEAASTGAGAATEKVENEEIIFLFLRYEVGLNTAAACGVLANIERESAFQNTALGDGGTSFGICQWHNSRFKRLQEWSAENGKDYRTLEAQLWYLKYELEKYYKPVLSYLLSVENTEKGAFDAGNRWCSKYEVPANVIVAGAERGEIARDKYWPKYAPDAAASEKTWTVKRVLKYKIPYMRGEDVKALQTALIAAGYDCGAGGADGIFGAGTNNAVAQYQQARGLVCDAKAGRETITALGGRFEG